MTGILPKKFNRLADGHIQNITDVFSFESDFKSFTVITFAVAFVTMDINIRQKIHFNGLHPAP